MTLAFWQLAAFFSVWFLTLVGVYWWGYVTGYSATNETIEDIVDKHLEKIVTAAKPR